MGKILAIFVLVALLTSGCSSKNNNRQSSVSSTPSQQEEIVVETESISEPSGQQESQPEPSAPAMTLEQAQALLPTDPDSGVVLITAAEQLVALSVVVNSGESSQRGITYRMEQDISLAGLAFTPIGGGGNGESLRWFDGTFDGGNHILSTVTITKGNPVGTGLFGAVSSEGTVQNLHITGGNITGLDSTGGVVGLCRGTLNNCSYRGTVYSNGSGVGGIAGLLESQGDMPAAVTSCFTNVQVSGNLQTGGLIGSTRSGTTVQDCYALGTVTAIDSPISTDPPGQIGGFIGRQDGGDIQRCYSVVEVYTQVASKIVGGFIGYNNGSPKSCYYNQAITQNWQTIDANLEDSPYEITGLSATELVERSTYAGWDFHTIWDLQEGRNRSLPYLRSAWDEQEAQV